MARKKIVFVIVEGPSDDAALGVILNRLFDKSKVHIEIMHGDITTDLSITPEKPQYSLTEIRTARPEKLILRNKHKQLKLNRISKLTKVWTSIPYQVYYMSCNLDHVLYGKLNSSDEEKENDAYAFAKKYKDDIDGFLSFISDSEFSRIEGYKESWEFIKRDVHSLERFTNFGLCFCEIRKERQRIKEEESN